MLASWMKGHTVPSQYILLDVLLPKSYSGALMAHSLSLIHILLHVIIGYLKNSTACISLYIVQAMCHHCHL